MRSVKCVKSVKTLNREEGALAGTPRETVGTVALEVEAEPTSLKRGVNEMIPAGANVKSKRGINERFTRRSSLVTHWLLPATCRPSKPSTSSPRRPGGFTLIELLVVIAIMAVLAALIIPITGAVNRAKLKSRTRAELRQVESAIANYKSKKGFYPPDNPNSANFINQLYYELSGTILSNKVYTTLDGSASVNQGSLPGGIKGFGAFSTVNGFMNTTKGGGDEGMAAEKFIRDLKPTQVATLVSPPGIKILVGSVGWDPGWSWQPVTPAPGGPAPKPGLNPFRYVSTNPTNNPASFDLWIDILVQGKTNRICNWSEDAIVL